LPALPFTFHFGNARHGCLGNVFVEPGLARDDLRASSAGGHAFLCPPSALASHRAWRSDRDHNRHPLYDPADQATFVVGKVGAAALSARGREPENLKWRDRFRQVEDSGCYWDHFAQISDAGPRFLSGPHAEDQRARLLRASTRTPRRRFGRARVALGGARHGHAACQPWVGRLTWPANCPNSGQAMIPTRMGPGHLPTSKSLDLRAAITPENAASVSWSTEMRDALSSIVSPGVSRLTVPRRSRPTPNCPLSTDWCPEEPASPRETCPAVRAWRACLRGWCGILRAMSCWQYAKLTIMVDGRAVPEPTRTVRWHGPGPGPIRTALTSARPRPNS
jgi:hypothetical protein